MNLDKYTVEDFIRDPLVPEVGNGGLAEILISQSLVSPYTDGADLESGSWPYIQSMSAAMWNAPSSGNIGPGFITGVKVMFLDTTGQNNRRSFQLCNSLALTISAGDTTQTLILDIEERQFYKGSVYFKVKDYPLLGTSNTTFIFRKDGNDNFDGYSCNGSNDNSAITFVVEPYFSAEENSIFNPLYNNVVEGVLSTIARKVEPNKSFASLWGVSRIFDDETAAAGETLDSGGHATGSRTISGITVNGDLMCRSGNYSASLIGSITVPVEGSVNAYISGTFVGTVETGSFSGSYNGHDHSGSLTGSVSGTFDGQISASGLDGNIEAFVSGSFLSASFYDGQRVDGGHMVTYPVPILVQPAEIPDYFYTALASISGRFLGSKTGYELKAKRLAPNINAADSESVVSSSGIVKEFISNYTGNYAIEEASASIRKLTEDTLEIVAAHTSSDLQPAVTPAAIDTGSHLIAPSKTCSFVDLGVEPAFFAAQEFQGSVYSVDAENVPDIKDMVFESVKFVPGTIYEYVSGSDSGSHIEYGRTYIRNHNSVTGQSGSNVENHAASLPILGDTIYSTDLEKRHTNARIFVQETSQVLTTNEFASVIDIALVSSSVESTGSVEP